jgi:uncharacterized protein YutE (UPF0331/DUF86 family)
MDEAYRDAMGEHLAQLAEELAEIEGLLQIGPVTPIVYRATERNLQLLIEACIGIAKQTLKARGVQVPSDARQALAKLRTLGLDPTDADWNRIVGMRNALVHDYLNLDPERITEVVKGGDYKVPLQLARTLLGG